MSDRSDKSSSRLLLFGDSLGCPSMLRSIPREKIIGLVAAESRPGSIDDVKRLALQSSLPFLVQPKFSNKQSYYDFIQQVKGLHPDLIVVYSYAMLLREDLLSISKNGGVNIHGGTLPMYRGSNPIQWEIINREIEAGISLHKLTHEIDAGDIFATRIVPIDFTDTWKHVLDKLSLVADEMLKAEFQLVVDGVATARKQDENLAVTRPRRTPEDGQFNWEMPTIQIYNMIRALVSPLPGAFVVNETNGRECFSSFTSISEVFKLKSLIHPLGLDDGSVLIPVPARSIKDGVLFLINDSTGKSFGELTITDISRDEVRVRLPQKFLRSVERFCKKELLVNRISIIE